ncbi:hypothetical protein BAU15_02430 [Enterococcus sp. JM4C]|uniref:hypothetical protein n=1 Tax=Candidatus Enterococcus huntleyi TaxID=1857217 RepID=UPI0013799E87|nr:hypothetical protein [Enterococcus sp. JM4C]KAF1299519.1 hypothetical protein BAU15_02430 [Enterococcus sp. JM4C]
MDKETWALLKENFTEFEFIESRYYRLREIENNRYEMACILLGPCGDKTYHPQITVTVEEEVTPLTLIDTEVVPNVYLTRETQPQQLQQALDKLVADFLQAKNLAL